MKEEHKSNRWSMLRRDHDAQAEQVTKDIVNNSDNNTNLIPAILTINANSSAQIARSSDPNQLKSVADVVTAAMGTPPPKSIPPSELSNENSENLNEDNTKIKKFVRKFFLKFKENEEEPINPNKNLIFGTDLESSLKIASATISVTSADPESFVEYGEIPIVVAKCGLFLKNNGLLVEGIFRVGGSSKRVRNLQYLFSQPPDFGRKLSWDGYNVHDAASLLRRFLNSMTEPVIPLELYEAFREPLRKRPQIIQYLTYRDPNNLMTTPPSTVNTGVGYSTSVVKNPPVNLDNITHDLNSNSSSTAPVNKNLTATNASAGTTSSAVPSSSTNTNAAASLSITSNENSSTEKKKHRHRKKSHKRFVKNIDSASKEYEQLVAQLPKQRKQLLLYILDLLDLFSQHSSENRMSTANLSAVFQPSVLAHPKHYLSPEEYILSQRVVEFLIEYSYKLLPRITGILKTPSFNKSSVSNPESNSANAGGSNSLSSRPQNLKHTSMTNVRASIPLTTSNNTKSDDLNNKRNSINAGSSEKASTSELPKVQSIEKSTSLNILQHTRKHSKSMSAADESSADLITNKNSSLNYYDETPVVANEDVVDNIVSESGDNTD